MTVRQLRDQSFIKTTIQSGPADSKKHFLLHLITNSTHSFIWLCGLSPPNTIVYTSIYVLIAFELFVGLELIRAMSLSV